MEAGAVPRVAPPMVPTLTPRLMRLATDVRLVGLVREGRSGAFEAVYDRHSRGIYAFCRHMLADADEAEDAVQHTFMAAYSDLLRSDKPIHLRAWLFTIARNRCYTILRARREQPSDSLDEAVDEGVANQVQRRQELRDLVHDLRQLPDEQRAALVLAELDSLSHTEIADVLSVPREKVKALVFQARESLVASRAARDTACADIREQLAMGRGAALRRANLRRHLRDCQGCREFRAQVEHQRKRFALLPLGPTLAVKELLFGASAVTGGAAAVGGGVIASGALKGGLVKGVLAGVLAAVGTAGTVVVATTSDLHLPALLHVVSGTLSAPAHHPAARTHHHAATATAHASLMTSAPEVTALRMSATGAIGQPVRTAPERATRRSFVAHHHRHPGAIHRHAVHHAHTFTVPAAMAAVQPAGPPAAVAYHGPGRSALAPGHHRLGGPGRSAWAHSRAHGHGFGHGALHGFAVAHRHGHAFTHGHGFAHRFAAMPARAHGHGRGNVAGLSHGHGHVHAVGASAHGHAHAHAVGASRGHSTATGHGHGVTQAHGHGHGALARSARAAAPASAPAAAAPTAPGNGHGRGHGPH